MKIIVFTDTHANLPALRAFRRAIEREGYDLAVHTGDAVDIGPYPAESLAELLSIPRVECVMGNHDAMFVHGIPDPLAGVIDGNEAEHCAWTARQLGEDFRERLRHWPYVIPHEFNGLRVTFVHYGLSATLDGFVPAAIADPTPADLDRIFGAFDTDLLFYGHSHPFSDVQGRARYINPGALGCFCRPLARYCVLEFRPGGLGVTYKAAPYDDSVLRAEYARRRVPAARFILKEFFGKNL
ncbi:MAG TPA: metallophosphoesterase family protein [candidate division Zixibacteria bacterium]|nr:metallophosphoesterase family protein [candidate division Zixibacteria bacterium]MDD4917687.1 metallophosphoesterase family protein [candidate division Zixibacteria bacterium]MDM7973598.1 metallophosphoesterase family protein [candidate division Zixibacteria bacterium]HOD65578.1 metallophosphoesterase family protein [candidate division Zixibacteria bacterium]HOZ07116.1 metallophosphoesterase family protein [candidate division Zixibacteria bacterium]